MNKDELKDEMKNKISMALKDPILQQGFEIICNENEQIEHLREERNYFQEKCEDIELNYYCDHKGGCKVQELERENRLLGERCNQLLKDKGYLTDRIDDIKANCDLAIEGRDIKIIELKDHLAEEVELHLHAEEYIKSLEQQIEKLIDFVLSKTECCDVCPITDTCINSEGTCPYAGILAKGEEEVTREWLMQFISRR